MTGPAMRSDDATDALSGLEERGLVRKGSVQRSERSEDLKAGMETAGYPDESRGAVRKAMNLLLCRDRSEKELRDRLMQEEFDPQSVQDAIDYVRSFGYIDDGRFAENYVASFLGKKSRRAMRSELEKRGVDEALIDRALQAVPEDESGQIMKLLRKKAGAPHKLDDGEKRRAVGFLARRGFSGSEIWKTIRAFESETPE